MGVEGFETFRASRSRPDYDRKGDKQQKEPMRRSAELRHLMPGESVCMLESVRIAPYVRPLEAAMNVPDAADLIEDSIRRLDEAPLTDAEFHGDARRLYAFQSEYEKRPTYFRVMELLERRDYFLTVSLEEHPDFEEFEESFDQMDATTISPVLRDPEDDWEEEDNPVVGYAADGRLYVERGGELWERLVDVGALEGDDTERPADRSLYRAVRDVLDVAARREDLDLLLRWYVTLGFHLGLEMKGEGDEEERLEQLRDDPDLAAIRSKVADIEDLELKLAHPERGLEVPPPALREAHAVLSWWYDPM